MLPRSRSCAVFVLAAAMLAFGGVHGQSQTPTPVAAPTRLPVWASAADAAGAPALAAGHKVIASTQAAPQGPAQELALPDDGLTPLRPVPFSEPVGLARPRSGGLTQAVFHPDPAVPTGPPAPPAPPVNGSQVNVTTVVPATAAPGEPLHYEIVVRNSGPVVVAHVHVEDWLPPGARLILSDPPPEGGGEPLSWNLGNLEAGAERRIKVDIQHSGANDVQPSPGVSFTAVVGPRTHIVRPPFAVTQIGPETVQRGATAAFRLQVSNNGPAPIRRIVLRDKLPPGLQHSQGVVVETEMDALAPGETRTLPLDLVAVQSGRFLNVVEAVADDGRQQAQSRFAIQITDASLTLHLDAPRQGQTGRDLDVRLEATNATPVAATGVQPAVTIPAGMELTGVSAGGAFDPAAHRVVWKAGPLAAGQTQIVTLKLRPKTPGDWPITGTATADHWSEARASQVVHVEAVPSLRLEASTADGTVEAGAETTYEVRLLNQGSAPATNVRLTLVVPEGLTPSQPEGPTAGRVMQQQVVFDPLPQLGARQVMTYHLRVRGRRPGEWRLEADLSADQVHAPLQELPGVRVYTNH